MTTTDSLKGKTSQDVTGNGTYSQYQIGLNIGHTFALSSNDGTLTVGAEAQYVVKSSSELVIIPYFSAAFGSKISLSGNYLQKGSYPLSVFNGGLVINNYDIYRHRLSLTSSYAFAPKRSLYLTGQWESVEDDFLAGQYTAAGAIVGLKWGF